MLSFDDNRWVGLEAGYRRPVDLRPLLKNLESAADPQPAWDALWQELHHQGDIGPGSFVAVPHLVRIHRARGKVDWNTYALVATIELARGKGRNPEVPDWATDEYKAALVELGQVGLAELPRAADPEAVRSILSVLAVVHGARTYGRVLVELTEDEVAELLGEQ
jgi:hypothetical protein